MQRRPPVALFAAGFKQLFYIDDTSSKCRFLIDTVAEVSVMQISPHERQGILSSSLGHLLSALNLLGRL